VSKISRHNMREDEDASYKYTAEFFGELLALDGWTINETAFTANSQVS